MLKRSPSLPKRVPIVLQCIAMYSSLSSCNKKWDHQVEWLLSRTGNIVELEDLHLGHSAGGCSLHTSG